MQRNDHLSHIPFDRVCISVLSPPGYVHIIAFNELLLGLSAGFMALGLPVDIVSNFVPTEPRILRLIIGGHLVRFQTSPFPADTIVLNTEQIPLVFDIYSAYSNLLKQHVIIDYSAQNVAQIRALGNPHVYLLRIGYMPALTKIPSGAQQDVDVLFYGSVSERRQKILDGLVASGLNVRSLFSVYGTERDSWIARSKIVLNMHCYENKVHEIIRSSYLLANRKAVVSECEDDTDIDADLRNAMALASYGKLIETCCMLVDDNERRHTLEKQGFEIFMQRDQAAYLAEMLLHITRSLKDRKLQ
jgi:hypothetical protein